MRDGFKKNTERARLEHQLKSEALLRVAEIKTQDEFRKDLQSADVVQ